ncbi:MAG: hypothetical protein ACPGYV_14615 [Phycisphaeraceae bacterium]
MIEITTNSSTSEKPLDRNKKRFLSPKISPTPCSRHIGRALCSGLLSVSIINITGVKASARSARRRESVGNLARHRYHNASPTFLNPTETSLRLPP